MFSLKIIITFAAIMIKYAFYILIGVFFVLGLNIAPGQELSGLQNEIEVRVGDTPQSVKSACILSSRTDNDCVRDTHSVFHDESSDYKVCDGILSSLSGSRNVAPFKLLKFNKPTTVIQILSALSVQLPESKYRNLPCSTSCMKYSCGYYIYTLAHIII